MVCLLVRLFVLLELYIIVGFGFTYSWVWFFVIVIWWLRFVVLVVCIAIVSCRWIGFVVLFAWGWLIVLLLCLFSVTCFDCLRYCCLFSYVCVWIFKVVCCAFGLGWCWLNVVVGVLIILVYLIVFYVIYSLNFVCFGGCVMWLVVCFACLFVCVWLCCLAFLWLVVYWNRCLLVSVCWLVGFCFSLTMLSCLLVCLFTVIVLFEFNCLYDVIFWYWCLGGLNLAFDFVWFTFVCVVYCGYDLVMRLFRFALLFWGLRCLDIVVLFICFLLVLVWWL